MKILFWIFAILSIPVGFFMSVVCYYAYGIDLSCTGFGVIMSVVGMFAVLVSVVAAVVGIIMLCKGKVKRAIIFAVIGLAYSAVSFAGIVIDDALGKAYLENDIASHNDQLYGENWNTPSAIEGIPELYQEELNKFYVAVRDKWPADQLMDLHAVSMADYYGEAPLDNIGFAVMDLNGDNISELLIGATTPGEDGGTAIFCIYSDPENPFFNITSADGEVYYLHSAESEGTNMAEIGGTNGAWLLGAEEGEAIMDIIYRECVLDPAGRIILEMIPFSQYK